MNLIVGHVQLDQCPTKITEEEYTLAHSCSFQKRKIKLRNAWMGSSDLPQIPETFDNLNLITG